MLGTGMNARKLGTICALLATTPNLIGCESSRDSPDRQFQKQVKRVQECRQLQDNLVGDQPITPERAEEIAKTMDRAGTRPKPMTSVTQESASITTLRWVTRLAASSEKLFMTRSPKTSQSLVAASR